MKWVRYMLLTSAAGFVVDKVDQKKSVACNVSVRISD